jgi:hypothetical protein
MKINFDMLDLDKVAKNATDGTDKNTNPQSMIEE